MPKQKAHKGLAKRVKVTARGKLKHRRAGASHLMSVKNAKRRRAIRRPATEGNNTFTNKLRRAIVVS